MSERKMSSINNGWWDYTTLDDELLQDAAKLSVRDIGELSRPGFTIHFYDSMEEFHVAEAMEYVSTWAKSTDDSPAGICGPIGPTEQLPLVARIVNDMEIDVSKGHFWAMDEWYVNGREVPEDHPLSFTRADKELCFDRIEKKLKMPDSNLHFLRADNMEAYSSLYDDVKCLVMQGGQGEVKHWAFNDPLPRSGKYFEQPPSPEEYRKLTTRIVDLHPLTIVQNARTSGAGQVHAVPKKAISVGPRETWKSKKISIWHPGVHDNVFGIRLTALMISKNIADSSVPMSLLAGHPNVHFHYYRPGIGSCETEMH
ncbi:MAG: hypothetical protein K9L68_07485 [Spirochaetales bacterium]|nr:hypothetical protein [Spirochaetales bacterium]MCF7938423.1 hypothetical protein [Spirochaetales bacterium]